MGGDFHGREDMNNVRAACMISSKMYNYIPGRSRSQIPNRTCDELTGQMSKEIVEHRTIFQRNDVIHLTFKRRWVYNPTVNSILLNNLG